MRVLVFGGRNYSDALHFHRVMTRINPTEIICGGATGADELARLWAVAHRIDHRVYYAKWDTFDKSAGPIRNQHMLDDARPEYAVAFPGGLGTADMMLRVERAGITIQIVPATEEGDVR